MGGLYASKANWATPLHPGGVAASEEGSLKLRLAGDFCLSCARHVDSGLYRLEMFPQPDVTSHLVRSLAPAQS